MAGFLTCIGILVICSGILYAIGLAVCLIVRSMEKGLDFDDDQELS